MDYNINFSYQSQQDVIDSMNLLRKNFNLSNFILWTAGGTLLVMEQASGPDAQGKVIVNVELLDQDFIDSFDKGCWVLNQQDHQYLRRKYLVGKGSVEASFSSKKGLMDAIKPFGTTQISKLLREATVSNLTKITDNSPMDEDGDFETSVTVSNKTTALSASETVRAGGLEFGVKVFVTKEHRGLSYDVEVSFDVRNRRDALLNALRDAGYVLLQGHHTNNSPRY